MVLEEKSIFIAENVSYALIAIIAIFIIIVVILFIFMFFIPSTKKQKMKPGGNCTDGTDCTTGLCEVGVCVIPLTGNCSDYVNNCKSGSTCVNGVCSTTMINRLQAKTYAANKNYLRNVPVTQPILKGNVVQDEVCDNTILYASTQPDMSDNVIIYDKPYIDAFANNDLIYIADKNGVKVVDRGNNYKGNLRSNIPITGPVEVVNDQVYTLDKDGKLYMSSLPSVNGQLNFIYQNRKAYDIVRSEDGENLYVRDKERDPHVMIGGDGDRIESDDQTVKYIDKTGFTKEYNTNGKYPMLYEGNIYLQPSKTKVYKDLFLTTA
jgi:hypothetical protein